MRSFWKFEWTFIVRNSYSSSLKLKNRQMINCFSASKLDSIRQSGLGGKLKMRQSSTSSNMNLHEQDGNNPNRDGEVNSPSKAKYIYIYSFVSGAPPG